MSAVTCRTRSLPVRSRRWGAPRRLESVSWRLRIRHWGLKRTDWRRRWIRSCGNCKPSWTPRWVLSWRSPLIANCSKARRTGKHRV